MQSKHGYTLVELLIVVAIIGILAGMTLPTYQMNTTKARMATVVRVLDGVMHDVLTDYARQGGTPSSIYGITGTGVGGYGSYIQPNETTNLHYVSGQGWSKTGAMVAVTVPAVVGEGIPGFVESTNGSDGVYNSVVMAFYDLNGSIVLYCGRWDSTNQLYVPPDFLPTGCQNDNIKDLVGA